MTATLNPPGPGTHLLAEQLGLCDPVSALAERHPPGDRLRRVAHALRQSATELDAAYALAREAGRELRTLLVAGHEVAVVLKRQINYEAAELALALVLCEVVDTALIRVLGNYQDIVQAAPPSMNLQAAATELRTTSR
ncbi:hypothetical protein ACWD4N_15705 [Streptomyces sp. NPDC002586]|uniref:hypothetical protein n=1 Tax=Streptomyces sp. NPDC002589 TaxID=3154420 RepID=UPI00333264AB